MSKGKKNRKTQKLNSCRSTKELPLAKNYYKNYHCYKGGGYRRKDESIQNLKMRFYQSFLPTNLKYLTLESHDSPFYLEKIKQRKYKTKGRVVLPETFSIIEYPVESYKALEKVISALLIENNYEVTIDYKDCTKVELGSQVLLDIILKEYLQFAKIANKKIRKTGVKIPVRLSGENINDPDLRKMIWSVGSPVTISNVKKDFEDIIPLRLKYYEDGDREDLNTIMDQKEIDTTEMADYVIACLDKMHKQLTPAKIDDLCTVIGEILINAEEHSSTNYRFSIGYFKEDQDTSNHNGIFRLVIMNFGQTIYEKFKDENCENTDVVNRMKELSKSYTKKRLFVSSQFSEESLWTLYALQEGVSSVSPMEYKRGNGSIRFIESFFNIKQNQEVDNISYLTIQSGKARIHFNGEYNIQAKTNIKNETFKVMTFNKSGNIEEKPDQDYVFETNNYFPGTIISAKLLLNDDDFISPNEK